MGIGRSLQFLAPDPAAYLTALQQSGSLQPVLLHGEGPLADAIASGHPTLQRVAELPAKLAPDTLLLLTETDAERLATQLLACVDYTDLTILAPITARHFSRRPLFIVSIPKGGTHLVYELAGALGYAAGVELPDFPNPQTWYCLEYSNSHTVAKDFFVDSVRRAPFGNRHHPFPHSPVLFGYRHPLDILVSEANYYCRDGKTVFSGYFEGEDFDQRIHRLIHDEWLLGTLSQRVGGFLPWLRFPNVIPVSFEELVGAQGGGTEALQHRLIWSILLKLQADGNVADIAGRVFNTHSATFHEGRIGAYRKQLSAPLIEELGRNCDALLAGFGYDTEADPPLTRFAEVFIRRPLHYMPADFERMAIAVETGFLGCNLVRFAGRFYAMPLTAGSVDFSTLGSDQLGQIPSASTLAELKTLLSIGSRHFQARRNQLDQAGLALQSGTAAPADAYWQTSGGPRILAEYRGFNLLLSHGRHLAIRQSVGAVDLALDFASLRASHSSSDLLTAADTDTLRQQIDGLYETAQLASGLASLGALVGGIESTLHKLEHDCLAIQDRPADIQYRTSVAIAVQAEEERNARVELGLQIRMHTQEVADQAAANLSQAVETLQTSIQQVSEHAKTSLLSTESAIRQSISHQAEQMLAALGLQERKQQEATAKLNAVRQESESSLVTQIQAGQAELKEMFQSAITALQQQHETCSHELMQEIAELRAHNSALRARVGSLEGNRVIVTANRLSKIYRRILKK